MEQVMQPLTSWTAKNRHWTAWNQASHDSDSLPGELRAGIVTELEMKWAITDTHKLKSQEKASSEGLECSDSQQPLTSWGAKDRHFE